MIFFGDSQLCLPRAITSQQRLLRLFVAWAVVADRCNARPIGRQQSLSNAISSPSTVCSRSASSWAGGAVLEEPGRALQTAVWTPYGRLIYKIIFEAQESQRKPYRGSFTPACLNNAPEVGDVTNRDRDSELVIMSMRPHQKILSSHGRGAGSWHHHGHWGAASWVPCDRSSQPYFVPSLDHTKPAMVRHLVAPDHLACRPACGAACLPPVMPFALSLRPCLRLGGLGSESSMSTPAGSGRLRDA